MINRMIPLASITFELKTVSQELFDSIDQRGIAIPVKVKPTATGYTCVDGAKRLTVATKLHGQDPERFPTILCQIVQDHSHAGSTFWGPRNQH